MSSATALEIYRYFQLSHHLFSNSIVKGFLVIAMFSITILSIISIFTLLTFYEVLNFVGIALILLAATVLPLLVSFIFIFTAKLGDRSTEFLLAVYKVEPTIKMRRLLTSFPSLRTSFGGFFHSSSDKIMVFFSMILQNVITLCVSFS